MSSAVTIRQKELVQATWKRVTPISKTAPRLFYAKLFELDPQVRALFPADEKSMKAQHLKLMQMIAICVRGLDQLDRVVPAVQNLGRRHVGYGVRNGDYDTVGAALLWTLEQGLGDFFDAEVKEAWANVYGVLAGAMMGSADEAPQRSGYIVDEDVSMEAVQRPGYARPQIDPRQSQRTAPKSETVASTQASEEPQEFRETVFDQGGKHDHEKEEAARQAAVATQTVSPALYGMGVVDEVSGQLGQVDLLATGLNVLAKVDGSGIIQEVNEGMEIVTGVPREGLLGTNAFSYFTEPERTRSWFTEALQGALARDKGVEIMHQEGETTSLAYNVIATSSNGQSGGILLCRYREG